MDGINDGGMVGASAGEGEPDCGDAVGEQDGEEVVSEAGWMERYKADADGEGAGSGKGE